MYTEYHITMDSFGETLPNNWQEIADYLNDVIDSMEDIVNDFDELTLYGREKIDMLWEKYCAGELEGAPKPIFE